MVEHKCPVCNIKFNKKSRLVEHMNKKYSCIQITTENDNNLYENFELTNAHKNSQMLTNEKNIQEDNFDNNNFNIDYNMNSDEPCCRYCLRKF